MPANACQPNLVISGTIMDSCCESYLEYPLDQQEEIAGLNPAYYVAMFGTAMLNSKYAFGVD